MIYGMSCVAIYSHIIFQCVFSCVCETNTGVRLCFTAHIEVMLLYYCPPFCNPSQAMEEPRCVRTKYGAWYLPVTMWKPRPADVVLDVVLSACIVQNVRYSLEVSYPPNTLIMTFYGTFVELH